MNLSTEKVPMSDFMGRFAPQLFERARTYLDPEYEPGHARHAPVVSRLDNLGMLRQPFPAQRTVIEAASAHLYQEHASTVILSQDMGTGKTLVGSTISMMGGRPQRVIVVVPPHLVGKWARELEITFPNIIVRKINHAGANEVLEKAYRENPGAPEKPEFWIIGRVRMRMSFSHHPAAIVQKSLRRRSRGTTEGLACPDCGRALMMPVPPTKKGEEKASMEGTDGSEANEYGHFEPASWAWLYEGRRTCNTVLDSECKLMDGCGARLWQAKRLHQKGPKEILSKALTSLPAVGKTTVEKLLEHSDKTIREVMRDLSNGEIHPALGSQLKASATRKVQAYLDAVGFTVGDGNYAPVEYIKRKIRRGWFDVAIFDELHELKGDNTAQGVAFGILAGRCHKTIGLTGTLVDGYAASLHPLLFRSDPNTLLRLGYGADDGARFQREMGVVREIVTEVEEDGLATSRGRKKVYRQTRNLPGLHPTVISHMLLPNALFLELPDIEKSLQDLAKTKGHGHIRLLPSYRETFVRIAQTPEQMQLVDGFCTEIIGKMKDAMRFGGGKHLMGPVMSAALYAADGAYQDVVCHPKSYENPMSTLRPVPTEDGLLEKERFMRDLVRRERAENRRVLIYTIYSDKLDLTDRYRRIIAEDGFDARVLKSSVSTELREDWVRDAVDDGCEVLICNPNLVKTGLDLFEFVTILFMQTGYATDTLLQASRRSWRIGQERPVRVYFAAYGATPQMTAMSLMAKKIRVSTEAKGNISDTGLSGALEEEESESTLMAIANQFLDGIRDRSHDAITGTIETLDEDSTAGEFTANRMSDIQNLLAEKSAETEDVVRRCSAKHQASNTADEDGMSTTDLLALVFGQNPAPVRHTSKNTTPRAPKRQPKPQSGFLELDLFS